MCGPGLFPRTASNHLSATHNRQTGRQTDRQARTDTHPRERQSLRTLVHETRINQPDSQKQRERETSVSVQADPPSPPLESLPSLPPSLPHTHVCTLTYTYICRVCGVVWVWDRPSVYSLYHLRA
mmetsp:Transcript_22676/g.55943  ORF Transcript_22676/g.55943 Transcript_22676/m.55943 type:complete len:125 (+) Transcript_22676:191-565(+)